jgi:hypothetical protein
VARGCGDEDKRWTELGVGPRARDGDAAAGGHRRGLALSSLVWKSKRKRVRWLKFHSNSYGLFFELRKSEEPDGICFPGCDEDLIFCMGTERLIATGRVRMVGCWLTPCSATRGLGAKA